MTVWFPPPEEAAALKEAVRILRRIEWGSEFMCPECGGFDPVSRGGAPEFLLGHRSNCSLDAFLKRWDKP